MNLRAIEAYQHFDRWLQSLSFPQRELDEEAKRKREAEAETRQFEEDTNDTSNNNNDTDSTCSSLTGSSSTSTGTGTDIDNDAPNYTLVQKNFGLKTDSRAIEAYQHFD